MWRAPFENPKTKKREGGGGGGGGGGKIEREENRIDPLKDPTWSARETIDRVRVPALHPGTAYGRRPFDSLVVARNEIKKKKRKKTRRSELFLADNAGQRDPRPSILFLGLFCLSLSLSLSLSIFVFLFLSSDSGSEYADV